MFSTQQLVSQHTKLEITKLPSIPYPIDIRDLDAHQRLISESEYQRLLAMDLPDGHICKSISDSKYVLLKRDGELHAVYSGRHNLGHGLYGKVKVAQNLKDGTWSACKITYFNASEQIEIDINKKLQRQITTDIHQEDCIYSHFPVKGRGDKKSFLMRLFPGKTLKHLYILSKTGQINLPDIEILLIAKKLLRAINEFHNAGYMHNDLHSGNVLYDLTTKELHIIDFGLSKPLTNCNNSRRESDVVDILDIITCKLSPMASTHLRRHGMKKICELSEKIYALNIDTTILAVETTLDSLIAELKPKHKTYKIGLFDIEDFERIRGLTPAALIDAMGFDIGDFERIRGLTPAALIDAMGSEIWLTDRKNAGSMNDYLKCRKFLESNNLFVGDKVFKHPSELGLTYHVTRMLKKRHPGCNFDVREALSGVKCRAGKRMLVRTPI